MVVRGYLAARVQICVFVMPFDILMLILHHKIAKGRCYPINLNI